MQDSFNRTISYLRLSVTDRCDFRCGYCLPREHRDFATPASWLSPAEIQRLARCFVGLGVRHIRLTGGEPLVRKELLEISQRLSAIDGLEDLSLSSNASRLGLMAADLRTAGVSRLNLSLDSLDAARFRQITGNGDLGQVLAGIDAAREQGFAPIKINMVAMRGINDDEVEAMVAYCRDRGLALRFIETMPIGSGGVAASQHYIPLSEIEQRLRQSYRLSPAALRGSGPARYYQVDDSALVLGFITPQSQHFCDSCNRVRLSVDGQLHLCLGQEHRVDLRALLRAGASDAELEAAIVQGIRNKPERHHFGQADSQIIRPMSALGG
jgi:cyclic pyranopterin phosphate synthase